MMKACAACPSSGASRHLLPVGEGHQRGRRYATFTLAVGALYKPAQLKTRAGRAALSKSPYKPVNLVEARA